MTENKKIAVVGAGVIGLATAIDLQRAGFNVTLIDKDEPGMGASFGNAGLFADYARLPFARFATLFNMPGMLLDKESPLSLQGRYLPALLPYGMGFVKACQEQNFKAGCIALKALQEHTREADEQLFALTGAQDLVKAEGCLGLFAGQQGFDKAKQDDLYKRQQQGVNLQFLNAVEVHELEPDLADFYVGGVYYPDTRFTVSPLALCRRYFDYFIEQGGTFLQDRVLSLKPSKGPSAVSSTSGGSHSARVQMSRETLEYSQVILTAGVASKSLLKPLGISIPLVSERGYHLTLDTADKHLTRPVGWLDKAVFLTPMESGVRIAGTAEFAYEDAPASTDCTDNMLAHASHMLGMQPEVKSDWVGSRPSTPDSLPVIGQLQQYPQITLAFGHGHLGLTLAAVTAQLVSELAQGQTPSLPLAPFAPERF